MVLSEYWIISLAYLLTWILISFFLKLRSSFFVDVPDGHLKKHSAKVSFLGGTAIFLSTSILLFLYLEWSDFLNFFLAVLPFFLIGFVDDCMRLNPVRKIALQVIAAFIFLVIIKAIFFPIFKVLTLLFIILLLINSLNLIDVSDGVTSSVTIPAILFFIIISSGIGVVSLISKFLLGALFAFLQFNINPARIYLGDSGVMMLGAIFFLLLYKSGLLIAPLFLGIPIFAILLFGVPIAEVFNLVVIRTYLKKPFYLGSPNHFVHYLEKKGLTKNQIALFAGFASLGLTSISLCFFYQIVSFCSTVVFAILGYLLWISLVYRSNMIFNIFKIR